MVILLCHLGTDKEKNPSEQTILFLSTFDLCLVESIETKLRIHRTDCVSTK